MPQKVQTARIQYFHHSLLQAEVLAVMDKAPLRVGMGLLVVLAVVVHLLGRLALLPPAD